MQALLKVLALGVTALFLGGAVLTATSDRALAAAPVDAGGDAGARFFFNASTSFGLEALPGVKQEAKGAP
ncbi:MAG: hypothetical protein Q8K32_05375 [Archangium sp.]|nr:hypothetical protein [Archangium sp.]